MVMVAKVDGEKSMVVIERIGERLYSMCTLKKDVKVKDVRTAAKTAKETDQPPVTEAEKVMGGEWWKGMVARRCDSEKQEISLQFLIQDSTSTELISHLQLMIVPLPMRKWT
jgi:hypothetical protein